MCWLDFQIIWAIIDREYCCPYCSTLPGGVLYIHNLYFTEKLFFPSSDSITFSLQPFASHNELLQTSFQTLPPSSSLVASFSYRISFNYRNS